MEEEEHHQPNSPNEATETTEASHQDYSWPVIKFDVPPHRTYHFCHQFRTAPNPNNFHKAVKWSPDGSCFLTSSEDNTLRVFTLPDNGSGVHINAVADEDSYAANLVINEGESVYDYCWYPYMSASDPITCVFASTTRDHPIHLWDATSGQKGMGHSMCTPLLSCIMKSWWSHPLIMHHMLCGHLDSLRATVLRCTYRAYNAVDEITAAFSVAFNPTGSKIFAGYNKSIRVFDIHRPGREFNQYSTLQGNKEGQTGIISTVAFCPTHTKMLATGSYSQTTAIYSEDNMELLYVLHGQEGGVTHVQFSKDGNYLYTGGRKDPYILCWDIRKAVDVVYKLYRSSENTNQRILFDIEPFGRHLGTGGQDGLVHIYDLQTGQWISSFQAASDTVNGFSFHPFLPMAASSSGHRRFETPDDNSEDVSLSGDENCVSVWSFSYDSVDTATSIYGFDLNSQSEHENPHQDP